MIKASHGKTLYIHIGHNKTGSSYIQSIFANSIATLQEQGIVYANSKNLEKAKRGEITTGNSSAFSDILKNNNALSSKEEHRLLFSSELLFRSFAKTEYQESFRTLIKKIQ